MNKQKLSGMDERDKRNWGYASNWGVMIVYAYTFIKLTYYIFFSSTENYTFLLWDILLVFLLAIVTAIIAYQRKTFVLPTTSIGHRLKEDAYRNSFWERLLKSYIPRTVLVSIIFAAVRTLMADNPTFRDISILTAIVSVTIFIANLLFGEITVRLYNKSVDE